jgi:hypothetical protein
VGETRPEPHGYRSFKAFVVGEPLQPWVKRRGMEVPTPSNPSVWWLDYHSWPTRAAVGIWTSMGAMAKTKTAGTATNSVRVCMPAWVLVLLSGGRLVRAAAEFDSAELRRRWMIGPGDRLAVGRARSIRGCGSVSPRCGSVSGGSSRSQRVGRGATHDAAHPGVTAVIRRK